MTKSVLLFGILGGALIALLNLIEFRYLVVQHSLEIYGGLVALIFVSLGIWLGLRYTARKERVVFREVEVQVQVPVEVRVEVPAAVTFARNEKKLAAVGITPRELQILEMIAAGLSNKEIADKAFVSENTVKTHSSRVFDKLGAKRRTQGVQLAKEYGLIP